MNRIKDDKMKERLKELRKTFGYTQPILFGKLKDYINAKVDDDNDKILLDNNEGGRSTISQLENGSRNLEDYYALAYADVLDVSLDYIYGRITNMKHEYKEINKQLGLSDKAIKKLEEINKNNKDAILILDNILKSDLSPLFIELLLSIKEYSLIDKKAIMDRTKGIVNYIPMWEHNIIQKHENEKNLKTNQKEIKNSMLFKVSKLSEKIAESYNEGGK